MYYQQGQTVPPTYPVAPYAAAPAPRRGGLKAWQWVLIGVGSFLVVCCVLGGVAAALAPSNPNSQNTLATATNTLGPTNTPGPTATPSPTATPMPTATPTHTPKWTTIQSFQGSGDKKTGTFSVPDDWRIVWTCDPSSYYGYQYNVIVSVYNSDGSILDPATVNTLCKSGNSSDWTEEHQGGDVYLDVISESDWAIQVQVLK
ncbi:MAG TPA: hypothetical protein VF116_08235 [Ktedonobacterales bacterium]